MILAMCMRANYGKYGVFVVIFSHFFSESEMKGTKYKPALEILVLIASTGSKGSDEPAHWPSLTKAYRFLHTEFGRNVSQCDKCPQRHNFLEMRPEAHVTVT